MEKELGKMIFFSIAGYLLCVINAFILSFENNFTSLSNGILIILLFYAQLLLFISNIVFINRKGKLNNVKLVLYQKIELIIRFIVFLMVSINIDRFGIHIYLQDKFIIIICSIILSSIIIVYQYIRVIKSRELITIEGKFNKSTEILGSNSQNAKKISLVGIILYTYSISLIHREIGTINLVLKFLVFCFALVLIIQRLKIYHSNLNQNKLYLIILGLTIGFLLNFVLAIILSYFMNSINIDDFNGIKDGMFIVAMLCAIPLIKEYTK